MSYRHLSPVDRSEIEKLYNSGLSIREISEKTNITLPTLYRELKRGSTGEIDKNGRIGYSSVLGQEATKKVQTAKAAVPAP